MSYTVPSQTSLSGEELANEVQTVCEIYLMHADASPCLQYRVMTILHT